MSDYTDEDTLPARLPWILLCHSSGGSCGTTFTVNKVADWNDKVRARKAHEDKCLARPRFPHQVNQNVNQ